jgi:hypothetical protein
MAGLGAVARQFAPSFRVPSQHVLGHASRDTRENDMRSLALLILTFDMLLVPDAGRLAAAQAGDDPALVRIRAENPFIAALIRDATGWSTTFQARRLPRPMASCMSKTAHVGTTSGRGVCRCRWGARSTSSACWSTVAERPIATSWRPSDELQHVIEVLRDPHITDTQPSTFFSDDRSKASGDSKQRRQLMWATTRPRSVRSREGSIVPWILRDQLGPAVRGREAHRA